MRSLKKLFVPVSNKHDGPCGVYVKCQACLEAGKVQTAMPAVHAALVAHFSTAEAPVKKASKRKKRVTAVALAETPAKAVKKPASKKDKRKPWVRKDSTLDKLGISPRLVRELANMGFTTVGHLTDISEGVLRVGLSAINTRKVATALEKYGKGFAV